MAEPHVVFLSGKQVNLRVHRPSDVERWYAWFNDPKVTVGMFKGLFPNTPQKQQAFFETMYEDPVNLQLAIEVLPEEELAGTIGLHQIDHFHKNADISIVLGESEYWGRGLGTEALSLMVTHAFDKLCLHKVTGGMYASNEASRRLFESVGFVREAVLREHAHSRGSFIDVYKYGLLAQEWRGSTPQGSEDGD